MLAVCAVSVKAETAPEGTEDFSIGFVEYYENDTEGNGFWVYFTADEK